MSDYSFMRSGVAGPANSSLGIGKEELEQLLGLFISNALITANKYCGMCNRNTITKEDINLGARYEVLKFFDNNNMAQDLEEIKQDYESLKDETVVGYKVEYFNTTIGAMEITDEMFATEEDADNYIDEHLSEHDDFTLLELTESDLKMEEITRGNEDGDPFSRITAENYSNLDEPSRKFIDELHRHNDNWATWEPYIPIQKMLKTIVDKNPF